MIHQKAHLGKKKKKKHLFDKPVPGFGRAAQEVPESFLFFFFPVSLLSSLAPFFHSFPSLVKIQIPSLSMLSGTVKHCGSYFLL